MESQIQLLSHYRRGMVGPVASAHRKIASLPGNRRGALLHVLVAAAFVALLSPCVFGDAAIAQIWHTRTPRDTVKIQGNQIKTVSSRIQINSGLVMQLSLSNTFGIFGGQAGTGFDARYTYDVPSWNAPFPLPNPPSFGSTNYQVYATVNITGLKEDSLKVIEKSYQPNHRYTAQYTSAGVPFQFRIKDRLNERPDGYYYAQASGGLDVAMAQFTAGIALEKSLVEFSSTNIGFSSTELDSIGSYGLDPLRVDSIWVDGPNAGNFNVVSERGIRYTLGNESTNEYKITFNPSQPGDNYAYLHIQSTNTDGPNHIKTITLHGTATKPQLAIGPKVIDFGRVRVGYPLSQSISIYNGGNATLHITAVHQVDGTGTPTGVFVPTQNLSTITAVTPKLVYASSNWPLTFVFSPKARQTYSAMIYFQGTGVPPDSVLLLGEGAEPVFERSDSVVNFGTVRSFDQATRTTVVRNTGNWTANIINVQLGGPNPTAYSVLPDLNPFLLNSDSSRSYTISYQPKTKSDGLRNATLTFSFDNGAPSQVIYLNGYEVKPRITFDSNIIDFGKVRLFATAHRGLGVSNSGSISISFDTNWKNPDPAYHTFNLLNKPGALPPGRDTLDLTFHPHIAGPANNWIYTNTGGQVDSFYLFGIGAVPKAVFSPPVVDFGVVKTGIPNYSSVILRDTGDYPLYVTSVQVTGPDASYFTCNWDPNRKLPDSIMDGGIDQARIGLSFKTNDRSGRKYYARLEVHYPDNFFDTCSLVATEAAQFIQFGTNRLDFGKVHVGAQSKLAAEFTNGAAVTLSIGKIWATPLGGPFLEGQPATSVDPGKSSSVQVSFAPTSRGVFAGYLHAKDGDIRQDSIPLTGTGAAAVPTFSTTTVDFGTVTLKKSSAQSFTLTNAGDWPLAAQVIKTKDGNDEFVVLSPDGQSVEPQSLDSADEGEARTYSVTFTPKSPQQVHEADLIFEFDDGTQQTVILTGKDEEDYLAVDSSLVDFGKVRIGTSPATRYLHLINNSSSDLQAQNVKIIASLPNPTPFGATPTGTIPVQSRAVAPITVKFQPTVIGPATAMLIGEGSAFENQAPDTVLLQGIGAQPIAKLSTDLLDLGMEPVGKVGENSATLSNTGNWPLHVINWEITGPNAADFTPNLALDTTIAESEARTFTVDFLATSPIQQSPRTATVTFTEDDGTKFSLDLIENDRSPLGSQIGFVNYLARPNDEFFAYLKLRTPIPDSLHIGDLAGHITYDPTMVTLEKVEAGTLVPLPDWTTTFSNNIAGSFDYEMKSSIAFLTLPGNLLKLTFRMHQDVQPGGVSPLVNVSNFPISKDVTPEAFDGAIIVDSGCGPHVISGVASGTFIDQNMPNPVAAGATTNIPFDIATDNTVITLRIIDPMGREVMKVLNRQAFARGRYTVPVDSKALGADGVYYYEFIAGNGKPQIKKLIVQ